jgi:L-ornithine N5-monooxygenase
MQTNPTIYDVIGIGFGPSNLALGIALRESLSDDTPFEYCFLEKKSSFVWHGNMLLDSSQMQISFLKDLVTMRNPGSEFTFIHYLHQQQRLKDFINLKTFFPSRREFNDYLSWVAAKFEDRCHYDEEVLSIEPVLVAGKVDHVRVLSRVGGQRQQVRFARNVVVSVGGSAMVPPQFQAWRDDPRVFHSSQYLSAIESLQGVERIAVVGAGQSAAEIFLDLHQRSPAVRVDLLSRAPVMRPADDSPFVNEIFNPEFTDYMFRQTSHARQCLLSTFSNTNYAVVDINLIDRIYGVLYQQKVRGENFHRVQFQREIDSLKRAPDSSSGLIAEIINREDGSVSTERYDAVILATGYDRQVHRHLLTSMMPWLGEMEVNRNYRLQTTPECRAGLYLQGCCEDTHGLSDTLLSVLAIRSQEIADALLASKKEPAMSAPSTPSRQEDRLMAL